MADTKKLKRAQEAYKTLCKMLDKNGWHYDKNEDRLSIACSASGDDLPIDVRMSIDADRQLAVFLSSMPFTVPADRRDALAVAVSRANYGMVDGSFDYKYSEGKIVFRLTSSFIDSVVGVEMFDYMLGVSCSTVDNYNDKFLMIVKSDMTPDEVVKVIE